MGTDQPTSGEIRWRLDDLGRRVAKVEDETDDVAVLKAEVRILTERVKALTVAAWSVCGALVVLAVTVAARSFGGS